MKRGWCGQQGLDHLGALGCLKAFGLYPWGQGEDIELFATEDDIITSVILKGNWLLYGVQVGGDKGVAVSGVCVAGSLEWSSVMEMGEGETASQDT